MKAMAIADFGAEPITHEIPRPEPGDGEIVVDVEHASINGMDVMTWRGFVKGMMPYELPITLGRDLSGTVALVGPGVSGLAPGDAVFGVLLGMPLHAGTFAEQVAVPETSVAKHPDGLESVAAGALGLAGTAAQSAIDVLVPTEGETVLVCGATGGVGSLAVQLAKRSGADVIATATPERVAFVRELGADEVVDHTDDLGAAVRRLRPDGVDAVLHAAGDGPALADLVRPGGRFASVLGVGPEQLAGRDLAATVVRAIPTTASLGVLADAVVQGELRVPISKTFTLDELPRALKDFTSGKQGKVAVRIG
jgi:NADPH:quinone reductase-like Zn-dependent oxidoreductase